MRLESQIVASIGIPIGVTCLALGGVAWLGGLTGWVDGGLVSVIWLILLGFVTGAGYLLWRAHIEVRAVAKTLISLPGAMRQIEQGTRETPLHGHDRRDELGVTVRLLTRHAMATRRALAKQDEIERQALTDPLTNLPNRRSLFEYLGRLGPDLGSDGPLELGVMHIDLDHFKAINDSLGHDAGDFVLKAATRRMAESVRGDDLLARVGGDEFVLLVRGVDDRDTLELMANRIIASISQPIQYKSEMCQMGASIGAVLTTLKGSVIDPHKLLSKADAALSRAKVEGRDRCVIYDGAMEAEIRRREDSAREIREALLDGEFQPWFQPMIDVATGRLVGLELLTRWEHPARGLLPPGEFLAAAEVHNMIEEIGLEVLERACGVLKRLRLAGLEVPMFHVNMTRAQLVAPAVIEKVSWILDDGNIPLEQVAMEIGEDSCSGRGVELLFANVRRFADLGVEPVIDDFGAVNGALSNISQLRARKIKCARSLTRALRCDSADAEARNILHGMVGLAESLNITAVAKGIEDRAEISALHETGFDEMQGDALAPAMDEQSLAAWLANRARPQPLAEGI